MTPSPDFERTVAGDVNWLVDMVGGLAGSAVAGAEHTEQLLWTPRYEVWRIVWRPGSGSSWHAHPGSLTAFSVVSGEIEERRRGRPARRLAAGDVAVRGGDLPHRLRCVGAVPATVLHAISPPPLGPRDEPAPGAACRPVAWRLDLRR